jgi:hypothetical protein
MKTAIAVVGDVAEAILPVQVSDGTNSKRNLETEHKRLVQQSVIQQNCSFQS